VGSDLRDGSHLLLAPEAPAAFLLMANCVPSEDRCPDPIFQACRVSPSLPRNSQKLPLLCAQPLQAHQVPKTLTPVVPTQAGGPQPPPSTSKCSLPGSPSRGPTHQHPSPAVGGPWTAGG